MNAIARLFFVAVLSAIFTAGCGHTVNETVSPVTPKPVAGQFKRVIILPFADYTPSSVSPYYEYWRRDSMVSEVVHDELYEAGFIPVVREDVVKYLIDKGVIKASRRQSTPSGIIEQELQGDWSPMMKDELRQVLANDNSRGMENNRIKDYGQRSDLIALDNEMVRDLGKTFGADYVVRGRILAFRTNRKWTFDPIKTGFVPFVLRTTGTTFFGVAQADKYDGYDERLLGGLPAGDAKLDFNAFLKRLTIFFVGDPVVDTVQVRVFVQDAKTGDVVWSSRAETKTAPRSVYANQEDEILFAGAIEASVRAIMDNLEASFASGMLPATGTAQATTSKKDAEKIEDILDDLEAASVEARDAALMSRQFAKEANQAAEHARKSAGQAQRSEQSAKDSSAHSAKALEKVIAK
jgi:hypothetical protein